MVSEGYGQARAELSIFERVPDDFLSPLSTEAKVVAATGPGSPFPPSTRRTRNARVGKTSAEAETFRSRLDGGDFGRWDRLGDLVGDLGPDATTSFLLQSRTTRELPQVRGGIREKLEIRVHLAPAGILSVAMAIENIEDLPPVAPLLEGLAPAEPPDHSRDLFGEVVLLTVPPDSGRYVVTLLGRSPFEEHEGAGIAAVIEVTVGSAFPALAGETPGESANGATGNQASPLPHLRGLEAQEPVGRRTSEGLETALFGLLPSEQPRRTLSFLARETGARLAADSVLSLPDARVSELAGRMAAGAAALPRPLDPAAVGWLLERETLLLCIEAVAAQGDELMLGLLLAHAGDVGRYPEDLKTIALACGDLATFEAALARERGQLPGLPGTGLRLAPAPGPGAGRLRSPGVPGRTTEGAGSHHGRGRGGHGTVTVQTPPPSSAAPPPVSRRKRRWLRRALVGAVLLLGLILLAARIAGPYLLPGLIDGVLEPHGLRLDYERLDLSLLRGEVEIWNARLLPREGGDPFAVLEHVRVDAEIRELIGGRLAVRLVEVSGLDLRLDRLPDGDFELLRRFRSSSPRKEKEPRDDRGPLDFSIPVAVGAIRAQQVRVEIRDPSQDPPFAATVTANIRFSNLGVDGQDARLEVLLHAAGILEALTIEGKVGSGREWAAAGLRVRAAGLRPAPVAAYLAPLGIRSVAEVLDVEVAADLYARILDGRLGAKVALTGLSVATDGREATAVDRLFLIAPSLGGGHLKVERVEVEGIRGRLEMLPDGGVRASGIEIGRPPAGTARRRPPKSPEEPSAGPPTRIEVGEVVVRDIRATFVDRTLAPPPEYTVEVTEVKARGFDTENPSSPMAFSVELSVPALVKHIRIAGEAAILAEEKTARLEFLAEGIDTREAMDYVAVTGLGPEFEDGRLTFSLVARSTHGGKGAASARLDLENLLFTSAGRELLFVGAIRAADLSLDSKTGDIIVGEVGVGPVRAFARRDPEGDLHLPGLCVPAARPSPAPLPPVREPVEPGPRPAAPAARLPTIRVRDLAVTGVDVFLRDEARVRPMELTLADSGVRIAGFVLEPGEADPPATLSALLHAPGIAEEIRVEGRFRMPAPEILADLAVEMTGITAAAGRPILDEMGATTLLTDATLGFRFRATVLPKADGIEAALALSGLDFRDAEAGRLAGLGSLVMDRASFGPDSIDFGTVTVEEPYLRVSRDAEGGLAALGLRLPPPGPPPPPDTGGAAEPTAEPLAVNVVKLSLRGAVLDFSDFMGGERIDFSFLSGAEVEGIRLGRERAARFRAEVSEKNRGLSLEAVGEAAQGSARTRVVADVAMAGLSRDSLGHLLPGGFEATTQDGRLAFRVEASTEPCPEGGDRLAFGLTDLVLRDGASGPALLSVDALSAAIARFDLPGERVAIDDFRLAGVVADVGISGEGLRVPGLLIAPRPAPVAPPPEGPPPAGPGNGGPAASRTDLPLVTLERVEVHVKRLGFIGEGFAKPLSATDFRLRNERPIAVLGQDPDAHPHTSLRMEGAVAPFVSKLDLLLDLAPFADQPEADITLALEGIRGATLAEFLPDLAKRIDASVLTDGRLRLGAHALLKFRRAGPLDFDLSRGFGMEAILRDFDLSNEGKSLMGIAEAAAVVQRFDPGTGNMHLRSLEIATPHGDVSREPQGFRVAGILFRTGPEEAAAAAGAPAGREPGVATAGNGPAGPEVRIDSLFVTDLDASFASRIGEPHTFLPLRDLTLEVRGFTTRAFSEPVPLAFRAAVGSDKVTLPVAPPRVAEAFGDLSLSGRLQFSPGLRGWVKGGLAAFELSNFRGLAKESAVVLNDGILDAGVDLRFLDDDTLDFSSRFIFTDLDMSEPADGPITGQIMEIAVSTLARLIVRAVAASPFRIGGTLTGTIGAVGGVVGGVVGGAVGGLLGGDSGEPEEPPPELPPVSVSFAPGDSLLTRTEAANLEELLEELDDDDELVVSLRVELGKEDLERLRVLANPGPDEARDLVESLRRRKFELLRQRAEAAAEARAALASGLRVRAEATAVELRGIDRDLSRTEDALDRMLDLLRPGADRLANRRTRLAGVSLLELRQQEVVRYLLGQDIDDIADRIRLKRPRFEDPVEPAGRVIFSLRREVKK
ncbi:MAG: DUF748 domain-containing protein [Planctomycetes bacterium]|nr:DUF748 domain-containing protein [Planctomycetota bacterium]